MTAYRRRRASWPLIWVALLTVFAAAAGAGAGAASPSSSGFASAEVPVDAVEQVMREQLDASGIPGGAFVVVSDGGVEARGVGSSGSGELTGQTPFVIGSTTKSFTALAIMQLVDAGEVDLDASVSAYVPQFRLAEGQPVDDVTVRHLLQQTSGITAQAGGALLTSSADGTALEAIAELDDAVLASRPGERWHYANANFVLAGLVVESASGLSYADYVEERIFEPVGMTHSYVALDAAEADGLSEGHRFWFGVPVGTGPTHRTGVMAAGYLISTAEDLGRYLSMYLADGVASTGKRVVSADGVRTMLTAGPRAHLGPWADGAASQYGMGWFVGGPWTSDAVFHPGNTPDSSAMIALFPDRGLGVATVMNAGHELPVPGNPVITDRVSSNVMYAALGQQVPDLPSMWRFYLLFDLVVLALLAASMWGLLRAAAALSRKRRLRAGHRVRRWAGVTFLVLMAGLVAGVPFLSIGWRGLWTWAPDLALTLTVLPVLWISTAALRLLALLTAQGDGPPPPTDDERDHEHVLTGN